MGTGIKQALCKYWLTRGKEKKVLGKREKEKRVGKEKKGAGRAETAGWLPVLGWLHVVGLLECRQGVKTEGI